MTKAKPKRIICRFRYCDVCGKPFVPSARGGAKYCGKACIRAAHVKRQTKYFYERHPRPETIKCRRCGQEFPYDGQRRYCSDKCVVEVYSERYKRCRGDWPDELLAAEYKGRRMHTMSKKELVKALLKEA